MNLAPRVQGSVDFLARFWDRVDVRGPDECWEWKTCRDSKGYGMAHVRGAAIRAHRLMVILVGAVDLQTKDHALHSCDNPSCANPAHLSVGSNDENIRQSIERGRHVNTRKTHCPNGHPYSGENLLRRPSSPSRRRCRECVRHLRRAAASRIVGV